MLRTLIVVAALSVQAGSALAQGAQVAFGGMAQETDARSRFQQIRCR